MSRYGIGIDTSCYTTSVAIIDIDTHTVVDNFQQLLKVKHGDKGLRQSDAFYQHIMNLGSYFNKCDKTYFEEASYIAVSSRPRNQELSYMPVFNAGINFARSISNLMSIPIIETDHQSGHLAAAFWGIDLPIPNSFLGLHLSGGTTELLKCKHIIDNNRSTFDCEIVGGSLDISAGQLIDRIGVAMDFDFPCGKQIETCSQTAIMTNQLRNKFPNIQKKSFFNLSGAENKGMTLLNNGLAANEVSIGLLDYIARQLVAAILAVPNYTSYDTIVLSGGVAANDYITNAIQTSIKTSVIRTEKRFCTDNAVGVAYLQILNI